MEKELHHLNRGIIYQFKEYSILLIWFLFGILGIQKFAIESQMLYLQKNIHLVILADIYL